MDRNNQLKHLLSIMAELSDDDIAKLLNMLEINEDNPNDPNAGKSENNSSDAIEEAQKDGTATVAPTEAQHADERVSENAESNNEGAVTAIQEVDHAPNPTVDVRSSSDCHSSGEECSNREEDPPSVSAAVHAHVQNDASNDVEQKSSQDMPSDQFSHDSKSKIKHRLRRIGIGIVAAAVIGITGAWFLNHALAGRFAQGTYINGHDVSRLSVADVTSILSSDIQSGVFTVRWANGKEEYISLSSLGCSYDTTPALTEYLPNQDIIANIKSLISQSTISQYEVTMTAIPRDDMLLQEVSRLDCVQGNGTVASVDASISLKNGLYTIVDEVPGTLMDGNSVFAAIKEELSQGGNLLDLSQHDCYVHAEVQSDDPALKAIIDDASGYENATINIDLKGVSEQIDWSRSSAWITLDENNQFIIDQDAVYGYIRQLAERYDTLGKERQFVTASGDTITVGAGELDCYGFQMDSDATAEAVFDMLVNKESGDISAIWTQEGVAHGLQNDFGDTYIEVSIEKQHMWFINHGVVELDTDVVTGTDTPDRRTPTGVYMLLAKYKDYNMTGSYGSAFCNYCIAISHEGICIHDSSWRSSYGGTIYKENGSHGCINTPLSVMSEIYNGNTMYGMPIIVY